MIVADLVFTNGQIITCDPAFSVAKSYAILKGRVIAVSGMNLDGLARSPADIVDLKGKSVLPGFVDSYSHIICSGLDLISTSGKVNIISLTSIEDILKAVSERAARSKPGEWIGTSCMYRGGLAEGRWPTRDDLDRAAPGNPTYIMQGGRPIIANSLALQLAGIDEHTEDPRDPHGRIVRDGTGRPTGQLIAGAADLARRRWAPKLGIPPEEWDFLLSGETELMAAFEAQQKVFHVCGITSVRDVATVRREVGIYVQALRQKRLKLRTRLMVIVPERYMRTDADFADVFESFFQPWAIGDDMLGIAGIAIDYSLDGWQMMDRSHLIRIVHEANRRDWTVGIAPGIGNQVDDVLEALERAHTERPLADRHFPIMHPMGLVRPDQFERARGLGLVLNPNPLLNHFAAERSVKMFDQVRKSGLMNSKAENGLEQAREAWGLRTRDWIDAGFLVSAGSNTPAAVYDPERPLLGMYTVATGETRVGQLIDGQQVSRREAIEIYTRNGATALQIDHECGSLEPGKVADCVVLDHDPLTCSDSDLMNTKVLRTYFAGELVYER